MTEPLLRLINLSKQFGKLAALTDISLTVESGEVLGIVGRRGAGKSTLLHLLAGDYPPSSGEIIFRGRSARLSDPTVAERFGIYMVDQKPLLLPNLDVYGNLSLGQEFRGPLGIGLADYRRVVERMTAALAAFDLPPNFLRERVDNLSDEQRQIVAIARALVRPAHLILLDDALAALSFERQERLLGRLRDLAGQGTALMIASDNLKHLFAVTDRIAVLYEGRIVADRQTSACTPREIVELIVGSTRQEQVTPIIWALESYQAAQQQADELYQVQTTLRQSLAAQDSLNRELLERLHDQVEALNQLNHALQATQLRLMTEREQERKHLARELHDQVIQDLLSYNYRLEEAESDVDHPAQREELARIRDGIRQIVGDLRQICSDLRPPTIDSHGLPAAIRSHAEEWAEQSGVNLTLHIDPHLGRMPEAIELSVFRIVQEGLNNVRRHACARYVHLRVERTPAASLLVRLTDDGRGMGHAVDLAALSANHHFGLLGISERVALLGGTMRIESPLGGGVVLEVEIPSPYPSL